MTRTRAKCWRENVKESGDNEHGKDEREYDESIKNVGSEEGISELRVAGESRQLITTDPNKDMCCLVDVMLHNYAYFNLTSPTYF
jgi:hypothetical protein